MLVPALPERFPSTRTLAQCDSYAYEALARATRPAPLGGAFAVDVVAVVAFTLTALALGALTLQRRTS